MGFSSVRVYTKWREQLKFVGELWYLVSVMRDEGDGLKLL